MTYIFRRITFVLVASTLVFSGCLSKNTQSDDWQTVYKNAYTRHDYITAVVALNHLTITDKKNIGDYYDSLSHYYIKKLKNYDAGEVIVDSALKLNPNKANLLEFKSLLLGSRSKIDEALATLEKLHKISGKNKHLYMIAAMNYAKNNDVAQYESTINRVLYSSKDDSESIEVNIDENNTQMVKLRAFCYLDKAKISLNLMNAELAMNYLDSALVISPNFQEAMYYQQKIKEGANK